MVGEEIDTLKGLAENQEFGGSNLLADMEFAFRSEDLMKAIIDAQERGDTTEAVQLEREFREFYHHE